MASRTASPTAAPAVLAAATLLGLDPDHLQARLAADDRALPVPEVAKRMGIGCRSCWRLVRSGAMPSVRITPRRVVVLTSDLTAYLAARRSGRG